MSGERCPLGDSFRRDPDEARATMLLALEQSGGNVRKAARMLGVSRRHLYRLIYRANLETDVARFREAAQAGPAWLRETRAVLEVMSR